MPNIINKQLFIVDTSIARPISFQILRGETVQITCRFRDHLDPIVVAGMTAKAYWHSREMPPTSWYSSDAVTLESDKAIWNWVPDFGADGAKEYEWYIKVTDSATNISYRAFGAIQMVGSPDSDPGEAPEAQSDYYTKDEVDDAIEDAIESATQDLVHTDLEINGHSLTQDIDLTAHDVEAIPESDRPTFERSHNYTYITGTDNVTKAFDWSGTVTLQMIENAGYDHDDIKAIVLGDKVTWLGTSTFNFQSNLISVDFGEGIQTIGEDAFFNDYRLPSLVFPPSLQSIGQNAFANCNAVSYCLFEQKTEAQVKAMPNYGNWGILAPLTVASQQWVDSRIDNLDASDVGAVPTGRTINNKSLSQNVTLTASDVGAATEEWVLDQITQGTAIYRGSFATKAALNAVQWQTSDPEAANFVSNNDYAVVQADESQDGGCWRYIYVLDTAQSISRWEPQYEINESPLTQAQLDALNSTATKAKIDSIADKVPNTRTINSKALSADVTLTASDVGAVTQSELNTAISAVEAEIPEVVGPYTDNASGKAADAKATGNALKTKANTFQPYRIQNCVIMDNYWHQLRVFIDETNGIGIVYDGNGFIAFGWPDDTVRYETSYDSFDDILSVVKNGTTYDYNVYYSVVATLKNIPAAYTSSPEMDGTASAGSSTAYAKGDHVHPTDTSRASAASIAAEFDATESYAVDDFVMYQGQLYKCSTAHSGAWAAADFTAAAVTDEMGSGGGASIIEMTRAELKALRDNSQLVPGQQYRITDYVATTSQSNTSSANHPFDIIVTADSTSNLNEVARAIAHSGDTYFSSSDLEAWKIWYALDNNTSRFYWADTTNGKGVVYRMIDEYENDAPFDFKGIQIAGKYLFNLKSNTTDGSLGSYLGNKFGENFNDGTRLQIPSNSRIQGSYNTVGKNCYNIRISGGYNEIGNDCNRIEFGLFDNPIESGCKYNVVFPNNKRIRLGMACSSNMFKTSTLMSSWSADDVEYAIYMGDSCSGNTFTGELSTTWASAFACGSNCSNNNIGCTKKVYFGDFTGGPYVYVSGSKYITAGDLWIYQNVPYVAISSGRMYSWTSSKFVTLASRTYNGNYYSNITITPGTGYVSLCGIGTNIISDPYRNVTVDFPTGSSTMTTITDTNHNQSFKTLFYKDTTGTLQKEEGGIADTVGAINTILDTINGQSL